MNFINFIEKLYASLVENITENKNLEKHALFLSNSVVITWLLKEVITFAIIKRSFAGRSLNYQLIIFVTLSLFFYFIIILIYRFYKNAQIKTKWFFSFSLLQTVILLISYLNLILNFNQWVIELPGFFFFFLINLIFLTVLLVKLNHKPAKIVTKWIIHNTVWVFVLLIIMLFFNYPATITFDSAHYIWLAELITTGEWASWDIIRNAGFPMLIYLSFSLFGNNQLALLIPMCIALIMLYIFSCKIAFLVLKPTLGVEKFLITLTIFFILILDATIFGYFHTLLTEYIAATIAVTSCFMALKLYLSEPFSKSFYLYSSYFVLMIPLSWHIKQPYMGAALFPLTISIFLLILRQFSWKNLALGLITIGISLSVTLLTNIAWDSFLVSQGNPLHESRHITTFAESQISQKFGQVQETPLSIGKRQVDHYLENINFYIRYSTVETRKPRLTQGFQNKLIAHRMYHNVGKTNLLFQHPLYSLYTGNLRENYAPPLWINNLFFSRETTSYFLFTTIYLLLPFILLIVSIMWIKRKGLLGTALLILGGTSFFNAVVHLFTHPIDRYLFMGYPLNLLLIFILLFFGLRKLITSIIKNNGVSHY